MILFYSYFNCLYNIIINMFWLKQSLFLFVHEIQETENEWNETVIFTLIVKEYLTQCVFITNSVVSVSLIKTSLIKIFHCYEQHLYFAGKRRGVRINVRRVFELNWTSRRVGLYFRVSLVSLAPWLSLYFSLFLCFSSHLSLFFIALEIVKN